MKIKEFFNMIRLFFLVKFSGVEKEIKNINFETINSGIDELFDKDFPGGQMPQKYWNYFLLKNKIYDTKKMKEVLDKSFSSDISWSNAIKKVQIDPSIIHKRNAELREVLKKQLNLPNEFFK